jgi:hypothetical protein
MGKLNLLNLVKEGFILLLLMVQCSSDSNPVDEVITCIITDKAKLEEIAIFPANNPLNQDISSAPVDTRSSAIISLIGSPGIHPDFGSGLWEGNPIGIPFILV